ncbi:MAG TPA: hypothetical protein VFZ77_07425 [Acidimicrobiales bacterium]
MAKRAAPHEFRRGDKVVNLDPLPGVPQGTPGRVYLVDGFAWTRYRVLFESGVDVGSIDGTALARRGDYRDALARREQAEVAEAAAEAETADADAGGAGGTGDKTVNGVVVPSRLLDRSRKARERLTAA